jgi:hypothetical protein
MAGPHFVLRISVRPIYCQANGSSTVDAVTIARTLNVPAVVLWIGGVAFVNDGVTARAANTTLGRSGLFSENVKQRFRRQTRFHDTACRVHWPLHTRSTRFVGPLSSIAYWVDARDGGNVAGFVHAVRGRASVPPSLAPYTSGNPATIDLRAPRAATSCLRDDLAVIEAVLTFRGMAQRSAVAMAHDHPY